MAQEWLEVLDKRNRTSKTKRLYDDGVPTRKFSYDGQVGLSMHYLDTLGDWQDVDDTAEEPDDQGFSVKFTKLSYFVRVGDDGGRRFYPDRNDLSYWIEFKKPFPSMGTPTRSNRWFYWDFAHAVIGVRCDVDSLKFGFRLKDNQAPTSITIPFETQGITRQGRLLLHDGEVVAELRKPIATGSNLDAEGDPVQKECDVVFGPGQVTISLDPAGLEYPIDIDPTVDKQVGVSGDDGVRYGATAFDAAYTRPYLGQTGGWTYHMFARWTGVTIEGTVDVSYIECYAHIAGANSPLMKVYGVDEDNPAAPTTYQEFDADPLTDAAVDWDDAFTSGTWEQSPSLNAIFQELVDTYTISNEAVMVQVKDDGSVNGHYNRTRNYDYTGNAHGPKLHIEYSVGGASYDITIEPGSYAVTGAATALPIGRVMAAAAGSYAVTGAAAGLLRALLMAAAAGSYSLTGAAVSFPVDRVIGAGAGSYSLTGATVALLRDLLISAGAGSYALTGAAVDLLRGKIMAAGSGSYTITGSDVDLLKALIMAATGGTFTLTGTAVDLLYGKIMAAEGGSYVITGSGVDLLKAMILDMGGGTYVLTGQTVDLALVSAIVARYALHAKKRSFALTPERSFDLHVPKRDFGLTAEDGDE